MKPYWILWAVLAVLILGWYVKLRLERQALCWRVLRAFLTDIQFRPFYYEELDDFVTPVAGGKIKNMTESVLNLPGVIELGGDAYRYEP